jgi:integrase
MQLIKSLPRKSLYVFAGPTGRPLSPSTMYHWMVCHTKQVCSRVYSVHELRHTMISEAARKGINPKVLQTITRHKRLDTLLKVYTHVDEKQRRDAIDALNPIGCKTAAI